MGDAAKETTVHYQFYSFFVGFQGAVAKRKAYAYVNAIAFAGGVGSILFVRYEGTGLGGAV